MSRALLALALVLLAAPLAAPSPSVSEAAVAVADCVSFGTVAEDAQRPDLAAWYATSQAEAIARDPRNVGRIYPGHGHPDHNDAGDRVPVSFVNRHGATLRGDIYLPPQDGPAVPLLFLQGLATNTQLYAWWHLALAERGYVVLAFDFSGQGASDESDAAPVEDAQDAVAWFLDASPVKDRLLADKLGVAGHSLGAITSMRLQAVEPRVKAVVAAAVIDNRTTTFERALVPVQIQSGDQDGPVAPYFFTGPAFAKGVYDEVEGPRQLVNIEGGTHAAHTNGPFLPSTSWSRELALTYSAAWFGWFLRGETASYAQLHEGDDRLSDLWPSVYDLGAGDAGVLDSGGPAPACAAALA